MASLGTRFYHWLAELLQQQPTALPPRQHLERAKPDDEAWLSTYLRRIGVLDERPAKADPGALTALERLYQAGEKQAATRLGSALAAVLPTDAELQLLVATLLCQERLGDAARPLLERVVSAPVAASMTGEAQKQRARWLLAELAAASGQHGQACGQLIELLAEDWNYPGGRERLRAQRARLGSDGDVAVSTAIPWLAGGAAAVPTLLGSGTAGASRYRLQRELGCGGNGTVYLAADQELGCEVALKLFHPWQKRRESDGRALHEARLLSSLRHPGVLFLYELDAAGRYLTMELCEGGSLAARLEKGPLPRGQALRRAVELCDTLCAVHRLGVVHGDIKPENLLFRSPSRSLYAPALADEAPYGDLVLSDFGIGIARDLGEESAAPAGAGTRGYLAPERLHGAPLSPAADLYAFGVVLKEMLGSRGEEVQPLLERLLSADPAVRPDAKETLYSLMQTDLTSV